MTTNAAYIGAIASAVPQFSADQQLAADLIRGHYRDKLTSRTLGLIRATFTHPSIRKRHFAGTGPAAIMTESADERVGRFTENAIDLSARAVVRALERAGIDAGDVHAIVVNTCTGYICPGISTYLIERLDLRRNVKAYDLVGSGCGGAIPNLQMSEALVKASGGSIVVSVSVEICSALFQMDNDVSLVLSNAIFGDGAAAAVLWEKPAGFRIVASAGRYVPEQREEIRLVHKQGEIHNQLSVDLADTVRKPAAEVVEELLSSQNLRTSDIRHWALHTGGEKIINAVRDEIGIPEERLRATRRVLAEYGNMSSPTVWFVLDELETEGVDRGDLCLMLVYGAGLSTHACLLRKN